MIIGAWMPSNERKMVKYESRRSVRVREGLVMRGVEFRSLMSLVVIFVKETICEGCGWRRLIRINI